MRVYTDGTRGSSRDLTDVGACCVMTHRARTNSVNVNRDKAGGRATTAGPPISREGTKPLSRVDETAVRKVKVTRREVQGTRRTKSLHRSRTRRGLRRPHSPHLTLGFPSPAQRSRSSGRDRAFSPSVPPNSQDMIKRERLAATLLFFSSLRATRSRTVRHVPTDRERRNVERKTRRRGRPANPTRDPGVQWERAFPRDVSPRSLVSRRNASCYWRVDQLAFSAELVSVTQTRMLNYATVYHGIFPNIAMSSVFTVVPK